MFLSINLYNLYNISHFSQPLKGINLSHTHAVKESENSSHDRLSIIWWGKISEEKFFNNSGFDFPSDEKLLEMKKFAK